MLNHFQRPFEPFHYNVDYCSLKMQYAGFWYVFSSFLLLSSSSRKHDSENSALNQCNELDISLNAFSFQRRFLSTWEKFGHRRKQFVCFFPFFHKKKKKKEQRTKHTSCVFCPKIWSYCVSTPFGRDSFYLIQVMASSTGSDLFL